MLPTDAVDQTLGALVGLGRHLPSLILEGRALAPSRRAALRRLIARYQPSVADLTPRVLERDAAAVRAYDALLDEAMTALRRDTPGGWASALGQLDLRTLLHRPEYCDLDSCPPDERRHILAFIDWLNDRLGSYTLWREFMSDDLRPVGGRPPRLLDLAAGHGGFVLALDRSAGPQHRPQQG